MVWGWCVMQCFFENCCCALSFLHRLSSILHFLVATSARAPLHRFYCVMTKYFFNLYMLAVYVCGILFYLYIVDVPGLEVLLCVVIFLFCCCSIAFPNRIDLPIFCFCVMFMSAFALFLGCLQKLYITKTQVCLWHSIVRPQRRPHLRPSVVFLVV